MQSRNDTDEGGAPLLERPLSARSVIASLLLGMQPPRLSSARLVRWGGLFGVAEGTTRVALSRMVERGELTARDGAYELAGPVRERQELQQRSLDPDLRPWDGTWALALVVRHGRAAAERGALRASMERLRLAELREGAWTRPDNLGAAMASPADRAVVDRQCTWWRGAPVDDGTVLAGGLFHPEGWAARGRVLLGRLEEETAALHGSDVDAHLAPAFVVGAAVLQHLRRDPLLPTELCPDPWPGEALRHAYRWFQASYAEAVADWFRKGPQ